MSIEKMVILKEKLNNIHNNHIEKYDKLIFQYKNTEYNKNKKNDSKYLNTIITDTPMGTHDHYGYYYCSDISNFVKSLQKNMDKHLGVIKNQNFSYLSDDKSDIKFKSFLQENPQNFKFVLNNLKECFVQQKKNKKRREK